MSIKKMETSVVGGAVRDVLLGKQPKDIDYVIINGNHEQMIDDGFELVGSGFPVYIHPLTNEEYAFARVERKVGTGYNGFECETNNVTLEDDLRRRDLTINSMAVKLINWDKFRKTADRKYLIDPFNGYDDLQAGILRHTSDAFAEDPIRVLRAARFSARYGFDIHSETLQLMSNIVHELNDVPQERIWLEFEKGLKERKFHLMYEYLQSCGALTVDALFPYSMGSGLLKELTIQNPIIKFALIGGGFEDKDYDNHRIPNEYAKLSKIVNKHWTVIRHFEEQTVEVRVDTIVNLKLMYDKTILQQLFELLTFLGEDTNNSQLQSDIEQLSTIDAESIALTCKNGQEIKEKLRQARIEILS